jgi:hypothetical protein
MKRLGMRSFGAALMVFCAVVGVAAQKVTTDSPRGFDFESHRHYAWKQNHILTRQGHENDAIIDQKIVASVNRILGGKGFSEDSAKPDFFISYDAGAPVSNADIEAGPGPQTATSPLNPYPGLNQNIWYSVDGVITFHLTDAASKQIVWTATASKKIRDPQKAISDLDRQVDQFVEKTFKSFPPKSR